MSLYNGPTRGLFRPPTINHNSTSIQSHLNEFNSICVDLESLDVKIDDEDKAILLVVSLPPSFKHFKEIMLYGNHTSLIANLLQHLMILV